MNNDLKLILDFVERHNKQDKEKDVAEAAARLSDQYLCPECGEDHDLNKPV